MSCFALNVVAVTVAEKAGIPPPNGLGRAVDSLRCKQRCVYFGKLSSGPHLEIIYQKFLLKPFPLILAIGSRLEIIWTSRSQEIPFTIPAKVPFTTDDHKSRIFVYVDPIPNSECYGSPFNVGPDPTPRTPRTALMQHPVTHGALERYEMGDGKLTRVVAIKFGLTAPTIHIPVSIQILKGGLQLGPDLDIHWMISHDIILSRRIYPRRAWEIIQWMSKSGPNCNNLKFARESLERQPVNHQWLCQSVAKSGLRLDSALQTLSLLATTRQQLRVRLRFTNTYGLGSGKTVSPESPVDGRIVMTVMLRRFLIGITSLRFKFDLAFQPTNYIP
ncbi:hypothetical protein C8R44DRAFT_734131 [Mycena epipterygia]|nr:hypothetical protein C8R44DRAFT_734131 [Mycena epipterygia]